jgi:hypothetical protein
MALVKNFFIPIKFQRTIQNITTKFTRIMQEEITPVCLIIFRFLNVINTTN